MKYLKTKRMPKFATTDSIKNLFRADPVLLSMALAAKKSTVMRKNKMRMYAGINAM